MHGRWPVTAAGRQQRAPSRACSGSPGSVYPNTWLAGGLLNMVGLTWGAGGGACAVVRLNAACMANAVPQQAPRLPIAPALAARCAAAPVAAVGAQGEGEWSLRRTLSDNPRPPCAPATPPPPPPLPHNQSPCPAAPSRAAGWSSCWAAARHTGPRPPQRWCPRPRRCGTRPASSSTERLGGAGGLLLCRLLLRVSLCCCCALLQRPIRSPRN